MGLNHLAGAANLAAQRFALRWAKENLPREEYTEIRAAYDRGIRRTAAFVLLCCVPVILLCLYIAFGGPFSARSAAGELPPGATGCVVARVDYDGNFYWTHDSRVYEHPLADYGMPAEQYGFGDRVKVYIDGAQGVVGVTGADSGPNIRNIELIAGVLGSILIPLMMLLLYRSYARRTFAKRWFDFYTDFCR